jgi:hypothetical protein
MTSGLASSSEPSQQYAVSQVALAGEGESRQAAAVELTQELNDLIRGEVPARAPASY